MENTAKKTAYIHIGMPKTGTTAIQSTLQRFFNEGKLDKFDMQFHFSSNTRGLIGDYWTIKDEKYVIEQIHKIISEHSKIGEKNIIFSEELLIAAINSDYWGFKYDLLPVLATAFKDYDTKIIIYIRRQDLFIESLVNQNAKARNNISYNNADYNYKELINRCLENFKGG